MGRGWVFCAGLAEGAPSCRPPWTLSRAHLVALAVGGKKEGEDEGTEIPAGLTRPPPPPPYPTLTHHRHHHHRPFCMRR